MPKNNHNSQQDIQIAHLQERVDFSCGKIEDLDKKVDTITDNHLPHIIGAIARLDANQKILLFFMMAMVGALIGLYFK